MNVNDLIVQGGEPLFFLHHLALHKLDPHITTQIIKGISDACMEASCALLGGDTAEMPGRTAQHGLAVDSAHDHQRGVRRHVVLPVVAVEIVARHRAQIVYPADRGMTIRVRSERRRNDLGVEQLLGVVLSTLQLRDDHGPLRLALVRLVQAMSHALSFDEQQRVERGCPRGLQIRGLVDPGVAVPHSAESFDDALHLVARDVCGPLEVHVLDPMRDASLPRPLVSRSHAIPTPDGHQRSRVELLYQYLQSIVQKRGTHPVSI